jgi:hypothetical protein
MTEWDIPQGGHANFLFACGAASPAGRLQILRRRVLLGEVRQRGGGVVVIHVILAKNCRKMQ